MLDLGWGRETFLGGVLRKEPPNPLEESSSSRLLPDDVVCVDELLALGGVFLRPLRPPEALIVAKSGLDASGLLSLTVVFFSDPMPPAIKAAVGFGDGREEDSPDLFSVFFSEPIPPEELIAAAIGLTGRRIGGAGALSPPSEPSLGTSLASTES